MLRQIGVDFGWVKRMGSAGCLFALVAATTGLSLHAGAVDFERAKWIWFSAEPMPVSQDFPAGVNYFRNRFVLPASPAPGSAELIVTADNLFSVYLNGQLAGESDPDPGTWSQPKRFAVTGLLAPGTNVVAVEAINTAAGPAGLLVKLVVDTGNGAPVSVSTDETWKSTDLELPDWAQPALDDRAWRAAHVIGEYGVAPWGRITPRSGIEPGGAPVAGPRQRVRQAIEDFKVMARDGGAAPPRPVREIDPPADYAWPAGIVYVADDRSLYRPPAHTGTSADSLTVTIFNPNHSRAFPEHDLPSPVKVGGRLMVLEPARPGVTPRVLLDAGRGGLGSPSVSLDGQSVLVAMARDDDRFFHIYRVPARGGAPERLTDGPFHDIDPAELPDGRIVFTSTRIGSFEEYHNAPSRSLYVMNADGTGLRPLTHTLVFDNEPEVLADGRIVFIRSDNFFDRGKVETLLHAIYPDGAGGYTEFGLDLGPEYGTRLRAFNCGSPAPLEDGRLAFVTGSTIALGRPGGTDTEIQHLPIEAGDVAALPDGRLLCTVLRRLPPRETGAGAKRPPPEYRFARIGIVDSRQAPDGVVVLFDSPDRPLHSPVYLGPRQRPPQLAHRVPERALDPPAPTGVFFCQNARYSKKTTAGWPHVRAMRVLAGRGLTVRSSHSYIVHAGSDVTELGTVPLAPDGSFAVEVPADTAIAFQAVDAEGRSELNEMSWIYVRPGETRGCVGCHQPRQAAPPDPRIGIQALKARPLRLLGQGEPHRFRGNNAAVTGLMELQFDRYREVAGINRHDAASRADPTGAREVATWTERLDHPDPAVRTSAAQRLAIFRDPAAAPALEERLGDDVLEVRVAAALALATCGTRDSVPPLLGALNDPEPLAAQAAAVALENLTGHAEPFNAFDPPPVRQRQARSWQAWFDQTSWDDLVQGLVRRLDQPDRDAVRRAAVALGHVGGEAARPALRAWVTRDSANNPYPEWRKTHQGDGAMFNARSPANPRTLQAATRALGYLGDLEAVPLLAGVVRDHRDPATANLFLAEAAIEALGRLAVPAAETALIEAFAGLQDYPNYTRWYGDHDALIACHASPLHYLIAEALDARGSTRAADLVPHLIRAVPTDPDRALLLENDDCETLIGRVIRRSGAEAAVVETCLGVLGDPQAERSAPLEAALAATHAAWAGKPDPENRAAQILSLVCRNPRFEPRLRAAFDRYRTKPNHIPRLFDTGIPVVTELPVRHWTCFYLARALGYLASPASAPALIAALEQSPAEAAAGRPDPLGPGVLFLHNDLTPCWRAAAAWALGRVGDPRAVPVLTRLVTDLDNATDTRHAAAEALRHLADPATRVALRRLAASYPEWSVRRALDKTGGSVSDAALAEAGL